MRKHFEAFRIESENIINDSPQGVNFLFLSWRDIKSPKKGGAEVHTHELIKRVAKNNHVVHFSPLYEGMKECENIDGVTYIRRGNMFSVIVWAMIYYFEHRTQIDFVVEQCNTHRFFTRFWVNKRKRIFYIHQLTREIWDINLKFPFNVIGKKLETWMLRLQRFDHVITVSKSTKDDLVKIGFSEKKIHIIPNAVSYDILGYAIKDDISNKCHDFIYVGRYSRYKGIDAAVKALGITKQKVSDVKLRIVGKKDECIIDEIVKPFAKEYGLTYGDDESNDIVFCGFVSEQRKFEYMENSLALLFPSQREGWGIIVTEAAALGTPSIVYDSPGCRDAVDYGNAGYLCKVNNSEEIANKMLGCINDIDTYKKVRLSAYEFAQRFSWDNNEILFDEIIKKIKRR